MPFPKSVKLFRYAGLGIIGSITHGGSFALTDPAFDMCLQYSRGEINLNELKEFDDSLVRQLKDSGFFSFDDNPSGPTSCYVHVTQRCNMKCLGCYSDGLDRNASDDLSLKDIECVLNSLRKIGISRIVISGGEPFLRRDLSDIVRHAKEVCGFATVEVITNGSVVCPSVLDDLAGYVDSLAVSFDTCSDNLQSQVRRGPAFSSLVKCVDSINNAGIHPHMIVTIHEGNWRMMREFARVAKTLGATMNFSLLTASANNLCKPFLLKEESLPGLASGLIELHCSDSEAQSDCSCICFPVKARCGAGSTVMSVGHDGSVYPCHMLHLDDVCAGNLLKDDYRSVQSALRAISSRFADVDTIADCSDCGCRYYCGGGCRARSRIGYGDYEHKDLYCALNRRFYEQVAGLVSCGVVKNARRYAE